MDKVFRFRSANGVIYGNDPNAFSKRVTTSSARCMLNELYEIANKHDSEATQAAIKKHNA